MMASAAPGAPAASAASAASASLAPRDRRRLELCRDAHKTLTLAMKKPPPCYLNPSEKRRIEMLDAMLKCSIENEVDALLKKAHHMTIMMPSSMWAVRDAVDDFIHCITMEERNGRRKGLEELLHVAGFPASYMETLAATPLKMRMIDAVEGGLIIAELQGHPASYTRFVAYYDLGASPCRLRYYEYEGLEHAVSVRVLPADEIVTGVVDIVSHPPCVYLMQVSWARHERYEQMHLHGIHNVFQSIPTDNFMIICLRKGLCTRCGNKGHDQSVCRNSVRSAAWLQPSQPVFKDCRA